MVGLQMLFQEKNIIWVFYTILVTYLLVTIIFGVIVFALVKKIQQKSLEAEKIRHEHTQKIDTIRKEHSETLEKIRIEMLRREEERERQWVESEKETLRVLNGISTLLDLSENLGRIDSEKILKRIDEIYDALKKNYNKKTR